MNLMNVLLYSNFFTDIFASDDTSLKLYLIVIIAFIPVTILGIICSIKVDSTFRKYSHSSANVGMTASQIARKMLNDNGLEHIAIVEIPGNLTDNYNPKTNIVSLSQTVFNSTSVSAIGVACHECGHAIQHDQGYVFSKLRSLLVPVVNFSNKLFLPIMLVGILVGLLGSLPVVGTAVVAVGLIVFGMSALFSLITLPTEFNASSRAQSYLKENVLNANELTMSRKVLTAAAMTYVAAFLASVLQFLHLLARLLMLVNRNRD